MQAFQYQKKKKNISGEWWNVDPKSVISQALQTGVAQMSLMLILSMDFQGHSITAPPKVSNVINIYIYIYGTFFNGAISRKYIWCINLINSI